MQTIVDFNCTYDNSAGIRQDVTNRLELRFPDAYLEADSMVKLSLALKEHDRASFCEMPFCHTVEAEAMGGMIQYGDEKTGPRAKEYVCKSLEDVWNLPAIDFESGRILEVLKACRELVQRGEKVVLEVSGPFTILNVLVDAKYVFRGMRKTPELFWKVLDKIGQELLRYVKTAETYGVHCISYADSAGGVNILGPKVAREVTEMFTYDLVKKLAEMTEEDTTILLCPKTTFMLLGTDKAKFIDIELKDEMRYGDACMMLCGKVKLAGQMCIKNIDFVLKNKKFKKVELL